MSPWWWSAQVAYLLGKAAWADSPNQKIVGLGQALVVPGKIKFGDLDASLPFVAVQPGGEQFHEEVAGAKLIEELLLDVGIFASGMNDKAGSSAVVGGIRDSLGASNGRGLLEVERELRWALGSFGYGAFAMAHDSDPVEVDLHTGRVVANRSFRVRIRRVATADYCDPIGRWKGLTSPSGGHVTLAYLAPPDRWDNQAAGQGGVIWRRLAGAVAPTSPTGADGSTLVSTTPTFAPGTFVSFVDAPGAGQVSYAGWGAYDEVVGGPPSRYSDSVTGTITV